MELIIVIVIAVYVLSKLFSTGKKAPRKRRPPFKKLYDLDHVQPIVEFERKMIAGMFAEDREIFVTAFVNDTHVLRVTATVGSKYSCRNSDNADLWGEKACTIGATKIRQYHNHPDYIYHRSSPSSIDKKTHRAAQSLIGQWGIGFESLLVYKSWFGRARIKKYQ